MPGYSEKHAPTKYEEGHSADHYSMPGYSEKHAPTKYEEGHSADHYSLPGYDLDEDEVLITKNLKRYAGWKGSEYLDGYVLVTVKHGKLHLTYDVVGADPKCYTAGTYKAYECGINIRTGHRCINPGYTLWDQKKLKYDPWLDAHYSSTAYTSKGYLSVDAGMDWDRVAGKVLLLHDTEGDRLGCSSLVPVKMLYAEHLNPYPDSKADYCVSGKIHVRSEGGYQMLSYDLHDIDHSCGLKDKFSHPYSCGIQIHAGWDCQATGDKLWNGKDDYHQDPWHIVRYHAHGRNAKAHYVKLKTGYSMKDVIFRTVVVYDSYGKPIACSKLLAATHLVTEHHIVAYPPKPIVCVHHPCVQPKPWDVSGDFDVTWYGDGKVVVAWRLNGVDPRCSEGDLHLHGKYRCAVYVHEGTHCNNVGPTYWDKKLVKDPWEDVKYLTNGRRMTTGSRKVYTGYHLADTIGRTVVIYDYDGHKMACAKLQSPHVKPPACLKEDDHTLYGYESRDEGSSQYHRIVHKTECFPVGAVVTQEAGKHVALGDTALGSLVLTSSTFGELSYQPVIGFLHSSGGGENASATYIVVQHEYGHFRATANHLVLTAAAKFNVGQTVGALSVGDFVWVAEFEKHSRVLSTAVVTSNDGLTAPITRSGTIVVDGVVASTYASIESPSFRHHALHSAFYLVRAAHALLGDMVMQTLYPTFSRLWVRRPAASVVTVGNV
eukprot:TRINITY_DN3643_c0_g1_i10.p1 TRINITY_DN3643_c0_g1~~TRINITY_DN3643_c0_g1_i10.p1  ORF type:complete len:812 (+),score=110.94 TRINITY_DN3643_c0_g1_i10:298-2436(+)